MKLRILNQSVRFRLRKSEVARLVAGEQLTVAVALSPTAIHYSLGGGASVETLEFDGLELRAKLTDNQIAELADDSKTGLYLSCGEIALVIEKDFQRTAVRSPEDSDLYANPRANRGLVEIDSTS